MMNEERSGLAKATFMFDENPFNSLLGKIGIYKIASRTILIVAIVYLPLVVFTLINGRFWTGGFSDSFITDYDTQAKFIITLPIFILAEGLISKRLTLILEQFVHSGIINENEQGHFYEIIARKVRLLKSNWTDMLMLVLAYVHVYSLLFYESESTHLLSWQLNTNSSSLGQMNIAGYWYSLVSLPIVLFFLYRWLMRIIIWGNILWRVSKLDLNLFAGHPDLSGGLGFLGYAISFFSPIAFAISAGVAGKMANFIQIEGYELVDLRLPAIGYLLFITILFATPLLAFSRKLLDAREKSVFENYDFANGMLRELRKTVSKGYDQVNQSDLESVQYSAVADLNAVVENTLNMKYLPFTIKDFVPLWVMTIMPFIAVVAMKIPFSSMLLQVLDLIT